MPYTRFSRTDQLTQNDLYAHCHLFGLNESELAYNSATSSNEETFPISDARIGMLYRMLNNTI